MSEKRINSDLLPYIDIKILKAMFFRKQISLVNKCQKIFFKNENNKAVNFKKKSSAKIH